MTTVYFASNRKKDGNGATDYGSTAVPNNPNAAVYGVAEVGHVSLTDADAGTIQSVHDLNNGDFSVAVKSQIVAAGHNLLIFIHGYNNAFTDAIRRAAYNREWFAASGNQGCNTTVIAFSWPSSNQYFGGGQNPLEAYKADQVQAGKSGFHLAQFFKNIQALAAAFKTAHPNGRVFLLAHSMGNWALQAAVQGWFDEHDPAQVIFDQVALAAADEVRDTFQTKGGGRLSNLPLLCRRINIYYSRADLLIVLSEAANYNIRLGWNGPLDKLNSVAFPSAKFRIVDCTGAIDYPRMGEASHQYYRESPAVRADIVNALVNNPPVAGGNTSVSTPVGGPDFDAIA